MEIKKVSETEISITQPEQVVTKTISLDSLQARLQGLENKLRVNDLEKISMEADLAAVKVLIEHALAAGIRTEADVQAEADAKAASEAEEKAKASTATAEA